MQEPSRPAAGSLLLLGEDVLVGQVLGRLQLRDLQALKNSGSRLLQEWVLNAPEAVWEAAALNTTAPYHPVLLSGDVRAYLAQQAAGDAAFHAGCSWPASCTTQPRYPDGFAGPDAGSPGESEVCSRMSHNGQVRAMVFRSDNRVELQDLLAGCRTSVQLPAGHTARRPPSFSPDDGVIAMLVDVPDPPDASLAPVDAALAIITISAGTRKAHMKYVSAFKAAANLDYLNIDWAGIGRRFCLTCWGPAAHECAFWVFDEALTQLGHHICPFWASTHWNGSGTGLLIDGLRFNDHDCWWWLLQEGCGKAVMSEPVPNMHRMRWGAWLPGTGEVMLGRSGEGEGSEDEEEGSRDIACWVPNTRAKDWHLLGLTHHGSPGDGAWTSSLRHVAVHDYEHGRIRMYVLQPGPQLHLLHDLEAGAPREYLDPFAFCPDGRYFMYSRCRAVHCAAQRLTFHLVIVHVVTGKAMEVLLPPEMRRISWVSGGIWLREVYGPGSMLYTFPDTASMTPG